MVITLSKPIFTLVYSISSSAIAHEDCYMQMIQGLRTIGLPQKGEVFGLADVTNVTHKC
jgi:hypothetical protein